MLMVGDNRPPFEYVGRCGVSITVVERRPFPITSRSHAIPNLYKALFEDDLPTCNKPRSII